jgi:predicted membrane channel-forming protein YqfA (hemolysin III family)
MEASRTTAIGGVLLAAAVVMIQDRMEDAWSHGAHLALAIAVFAVLYGLAVASTPEEGPRPTVSQSALFVASLVVLVAAVIRLGQVTGTSDPEEHAGTALWMALVFGAIALFPAVRFGSAICTLAAALAFGIAFVEFCHKFLSADRPDAFRWLFLITAVAFAAGAAIVRARWPRHAAQLVNAMTVGSLAILGTVAFGIPFGDEGDTVPHLSTWWELVALALPLVSIGYALLFRERGPAWAGAATLGIAVLVIGEPESVIGSNAHATLKGWPLVLLGAGAVAIVASFVEARRT